MKKILVIEDTKSEIETCCMILREAGIQYVVASSLEEATFALETGSFDGVLTDLHFPEKSVSDKIPPCGLAVLVLCAEKSVPVVVVSDIDHHFATYAKVVVNGIAKLHPKGQIPFVMDSKNWSRGLQLLEELQ